MRLFKPYAYSYLALHGLVDLVLAVRLYYRVETLAPSVAFIFAGTVLSIFLFFGIKNEQLPGRYGIRVNRWSEPAAYWSGFTLLVVSRLIFTVTVAL